MASPAAAAERWASPDSTLTTGSCSALQPCTLASALSGAVAGDDVVAGSGDYTVGEPLAVGGGVVLHGVAGSSRPRLLATAALLSETLSVGAGATARHLEVRPAAGKPGLDSRGGTGEDLVVVAQDASAVDLKGEPGGTVLRDSVAIARGAGVTAVGIKDHPNKAAGPVTLVNVTAYAPTGTAVHCATVLGATRLVDVAARGESRDVVVEGAGVQCATSHSAYRPEASPGVVAGPGDVAGDPAFLAPEANDLHLAAGSPLIDAGTTDPLAGRVDVDGRERPYGSAPDIGAYEWVPGPVADPIAPTPDPSDPPAPIDPPVLGKKVVVAASQGVVRFRAPGGRFVTLDGTSTVPTGSLLDARKGTVELQSALPGAGTTQTGRFRGGLFVVRQPAGGSGMTELVLSGGDLASCPRRGTAVKAGASRRKKAKGRRLWASDDGGKFRTRGSNSVATARGTAWFTEDRCDGTLTRVTEGSVQVKPARGRAFLLRKGQKRLVPARAAR